MASDEEHWREERDSFGAVRVPKHAFYGAQTQRAVDNFQFSDLTLPRGMIAALGMIKGACAEVNAEAGRLAPPLAAAIKAAAEEVVSGQHDNHFPVDLFQTGSGTSSHMNANEVIAHLAGRQLGRVVHPNDTVNLGQSSNDVFPTCIHLAAALALKQRLLPDLAHLIRVIENRRHEIGDVVKTGRTHLMDAMPLTLDQELSGWQTQLEHSVGRLQGVMPRLQQLALGGTAVGTGINAPPGMAAEVCERLSARTGLELRPAENYFEALSCQDTAVELSGQLKVLAVALIKICNDLRWAASGPLAGLAELQLPALQPGSSIMPGKVNPVIPEAVLMAATQVIGNDSVITLAGQAGNFQLNVMLPLVAYNLLQSIDLLASSTLALASKVIATMEPDRERLAQGLAKNPVLVTALNPIVGYDLGATIAKRAYREGRPVLEIAIEETDLDPDELARLLDPARLCHPSDGAE